MRIKILLIAFLAVIIQFQSKAAEMPGYYYGGPNYGGPSYGEPNIEAESQFYLTSVYTIVTPSPDYIFAIEIPPMFQFDNILSQLIIDDVEVPISKVTFTKPGPNFKMGVYITLKDPTLAVVGAKIAVGFMLRAPSYAGSYSFDRIRTLSNDGTTIDSTGIAGYGSGITIAPKRVTFTTTTNITNTGFKANWIMSLGATNYFLDVSTSSTFDTFLPVYSSLNIGNVLSYTMNGLTPNTTYYFRLRAAFASYSSPFLAFSPYTSVNVTTLSGTMIPATVSLSNLTAIYDGSTHSATATTVPSSLTVVTTYNGSTTVPTNVGTYAVVSTIMHGNYQGSASGSLVISKATANPVLGNLTKTYNGTAQVFTATTSPSNLNVIKTYNGFSSIPTNVGTYAVAAIVSDPNYQGTTSGSFVISKANATVSLSNVTATYNGSTHAATATTVPSGLAIVTTYNGSSTVPTNAGTYAVVSTISNANYQGTTSGSLVISKAAATLSLSNLTATFDGSSHSSIVTTVPSGLAIVTTYNGSSTVPTNAGTYAVVSTISNANYQGTTSGSLVISKAAATISLSNLTATYDGSTHSATATTIPAGLTVVTTYNGAASVPTNAGTYAVVATISDANYQGTTSGSLEITSISTNVTGQFLNDVQLYPNPSKDVIWVRASVSVITKISVMNLTGVTVFEKDNCSQLESLDISNLAKGVYIVCVEAESGRGTYRVIVY